MCFSHDNTRLHSARITHEKINGYRLVRSIPSTIFITELELNDFHVFLFSTKCYERQKNFSRRSGENFCWAWNQLNFTWKESTSYLMNGKRWFKIMVNMLFIEINLLLNYSWMNYILLKWKLFMSPSNTNNMYTVIWYQVFLSNMNNFQTDLFDL